MISNIPIPNNESKIWSDIPNKLSVCLIEFRCHKYIEKILHNMLNIYGGTDVMIYERSHDENGSLCFSDVGSVCS